MIHDILLYQMRDGKWNARRESGAVGTLYSGACDTPAEALLRVTGEHPPFTLARLQEEQAEWSARNFGLQPGWQCLLGATEELGELCHAYLKSAQGIRGTEEEHRAAAIDAVADVIVYLAGFCTACGIDLDDAVKRTWERVRARDWNKNKTTGDADVDAARAEAERWAPSGIASS